jgi:transcriptional regulator with XRE-family HTH domain
MVRGDLNQIAFAEAVEIKQPMVSRYEADHETPSPRVLLRIAQYAGTSIEWLLTGSDAGPKRSAGKGDLVAQAAKLLRKTGNPEAKDFTDMMKVVFADREKMKKLLSGYRSGGRG